jgi:hypothetical protein
VLACGGDQASRHGGARLSRGSDDATIGEGKERPNVKGRKEWGRGASGIGRR